MRASTQHGARCQTHAAAAAAARRLSTKRDVNKNRCASSSSFLFPSSSTSCYSLRRSSPVMSGVVAVHVGESWPQGKACVCSEGEIRAWGIWRVLAPGSHGPLAPAKGLFFGSWGHLWPVPWLSVLWVTPHSVEGWCIPPVTGLHL